LIILKVLAFTMSNVVRPAKMSPWNNKEVVTGRHLHFARSSIEERIKKLNGE